jgi:putative transposase
VADPTRPRKSNRYNPDIHHRRSIRLKGHDYSCGGIYFVTMVCQGRAFLLESDAVRKIVQAAWDGLPKRFPHVELDEFVIMPNHIHGLITVSNPNGSDPAGAIRELPLREDRKQRRVMTLPKIVGYFKTNTAKEINRIHRRPGCPAWQRNYYEHVVRGEEELARIRKYIRDNPLNWETDDENPNRM